MMTVVFWIVGAVTTAAMALHHTSVTLQGWQMYLGALLLAVFVSFVPSMAGAAWEESKWNRLKKTKEAWQKINEELTRLKALLFDKQEQLDEALAKLAGYEEIAREEVQSTRYIRVRKHALLAGHTEPYLIKRGGNGR